MKIYGNMEMLEHEIQNAALKTETNFPTSSKAGRIVFKDKQVWIAAQIDGETPLWVPLTHEIDHYTHMQTTSSTTWIIAHNLNTTEVAITVYDDATDSVVIPDTVTLTDANTVTVTFATAMIGKAVVTHGLFDEVTAESGFEVLVMNTNSTDGSTTFVDETGTVSLTAVGGMQHSITEAKFGATSARSLGNSEYISASDTTQTDLGLGNEPFTIECWVNLTDVNVNQTFVLKYGGGSGWNATNGIQYHFSFGADGVLAFWNWTGSVDQKVETPWSPNAGQWYHLAATMDGSTRRLFIDGSLVATAAVGSFAKPATSNLTTIGQTFQGYIDSVRIEKGYARYTSAFTPPTKRFTV